jgi:hypothetical protein
MSETVVIDPRFNGPADSANGGYTCGVVARSIDGPAEVTLRRPPPIGRELSLERDGDRVVLLDGEELVAEGIPVEPDWDVPEPVTIAEAAGAVAGSYFLQRPRPFVTCFVCGPDRPDDDGLALYPGPIPGRNLIATPWTPDHSLPRAADGTLASEIVWASLDCPTSGPVANSPGPDGALRPIVLAQLAAEIRTQVEVGRPHVVTAWGLAIDGRKRQAGSALFTADGELLASARALWIELRAPA